MLHNSLHVCLVLLCLRVLCVYHFQTPSLVILLSYYWLNMPRSKHNCFTWVNVCFPSGIINTSEKVHSFFPWKDIYFCTKKNILSWQHEMKQKQKNNDIPLNYVVKHKYNNCCCKKRRNRTVKVIYLASQRKRLFSVIGFVFGKHYSNGSGD